MKSHGIRSLFADTRGTTIIEFAIIAPIFFFLLFAVFEFGLITYTQMGLEAAVDEAGRDVMVNEHGPGLCPSVSDFTSEVRTKTSGLLNGSNVSVTAQVVNSAGAGGTALPDICMDNPNAPSSAPATCQLWQEVNGIQGYQNISATNLGCAGSEVQLLVTLPYVIQFPLLKHLFSAPQVAADGTPQANVDGIRLLSATTIIRTESQ